jgi:hypothetical protein
MYREHHFDEYDVAAYCNPLHRAPFINLQHWAVEIGDTVYEVTRRDTDPNKPNPVLRCISSQKWWQEATTLASNPQSRFLGTTDESDQRLKQLATYIWSGVMKSEYAFWVSNCQTFANIFRKLIVHNDKLSLELKAKIQPMPMPFNPFVAIGEKARLVRRMVAKDNAVSRWTSLFRALSGASPASYGPIFTIPRRQSQGWLDTLKHESKTRELKSDNDFYSIVRRVNKKTKAEQETLWQSLLRLIGFR